MTLPLRWLTEALAVAPQLTPDQMAAAKAAGFQTVICNRPDGEEGPHQPRQADVEAAAVAEGMRFAYLPVASGGQTPEEALRMGELLSELPKPILAYCRSGGRCMSLISLAAQLGQPIPR